MKFRPSILILIILFLIFQPTTGAENEYGIVRAWFNGENATVNNVQVKIGEPFEVKVELLSKINGDISFKLYEPGVTRAFKVINGPGEIEKRIDIMNIESGWSKTYTWTVESNEAWKGGKAPLNVIVQFNKGMNNKQIDFTIANPYILDEQYTGAAATTSAPEIAGTGAQTKETPFPSVMFTLATLLAASRWRRR